MITTIEDMYQYRIHKILKKLEKDYYEDRDLENTQSFEDFMNSSNFDSVLGEAIYNDICNYCGLEEALESAG